MSGRPSVALCSHSPIDRTYPDGFAMRSTCIAEALAEAFDLTIVDVGGPDASALDHEPTVLARASRATLTLKGDLRRLLPTRGALAPIGRKLSIAASLATARPNWQIGMGRAARAAVAGSGLASHDLVVLPYLLAHLATALAPEQRCVVFLEEGVERRLPIDHPRMPVVSTVHAGLRRSAAEALYRKVGARASAVAVISDVERLHFAGFVPSERLHVVPLTVDPALLALEPPAPPVGSEIAVLVSGLFALGGPAYTGLAALLSEADRALRAAGRDPLWVLAGRGADELELPGLRKEAALGASLVDAYARADLVLVPGRTQIGLRSTFLQGLASGRPTVATWDTLWTAGAEPGIHAFAADGPAMLPSALAAAAAGTELAAVGGAGRRLYEERYSWGLVGAAALETCRAALALEP